MKCLVAVSTSNGPFRDVFAARSVRDQARTMTESREIPSQLRRKEYVTTEGELGEHIRECIARCLDCRNICMKVADDYLRLKNVKSECPDLRSLLNCSEICATAARFMLRGSEFGPHLCRVCADVCKSCVGLFSGMRDHAEMAACVAACRQCAECCERIAGAAAAVGLRPAVPLAPAEAARG